MNDMKLIKNLILTCFCILFFLSCTDRKEHRKQQFLLKGNEASQNQNFPSAIYYYEEAIKTDSCYATALNNLATVYYRQGKKDQALHLYERAVKCEPNFYLATLNLSNTLYDLKQYYRSLDVLERQLEKTPDSAQVYFAIGLNLTKLRDYDSAIVVFKNALELQPENTEILINIGTLEYYKENYSQAESYLTRATTIDDRQSEAYNTLALVATAEEDFKTALNSINTALELNEQPHYFNNKGFILIKMGRLEEAEKNINESIVTEPFNAWAFRNKAILMLERKKPSEALKLLERAKKLDDWVEDIHYYTGQAYVQLAENDRACENFRKGAILREKKSEDALNTLCK